MNQRQKNHREPFKKTGKNLRIHKRKDIDKKPVTLKLKIRPQQNQAGENNSFNMPEAAEQNKKSRYNSGKEQYRKNSSSKVFQKKKSGSTIKANKYERTRTGKFSKGTNTKERNSFVHDDRNSFFPGSKLVRLNKYIANAGICSRRDADKLIVSGVIKVNGVIITELGTKIKPGDRVEYSGQMLRGEQLRYLLLNKPKGYITTLEDPHERKTVMLLIEHACKERIYPVGRLDRNTTGLLLFTNDGDIAKKLTHPKHRVRKVYHIELDKALIKNDMLLIANGVELEDGLIMPDEIAYSEPGDDRKKIDIEIHSGRNRIVRRIFEKFGYDVIKLDRIVFANLTKKNLPRGKWRHLTQTEVNILRRIN